MATRAYEAAPLNVLLATIPSLPRPILARLTARMIDRLDEIDGDPDLEPDDHDEDDDPPECNGDPEIVGESWPEPMEVRAYH